MDLPSRNARTDRFLLVSPQRNGTFQAGQSICCQLRATKPHHHGLRQRRHLDIIQRHREMPALRPAESTTG